MGLYSCTEPCTQKFETRKALNIHQHACQASIRDDPNSRIFNASELYAEKKAHKRRRLEENRLNLSMAVSQSTEALQSLDHNDLNQAIPGFEAEVVC